MPAPVVSYASNKHQTNPFTQNKFTRFFGGTKWQIDPYVSGFFLVGFSVPNVASVNMSSEPGGTAASAVPGGTNTSWLFLTSINTAVTVPDYNIDKIPVNALGGLKFQVPGGLTMGDSLELTSVVRPAQCPRRISAGPHGTR